VSFTAVLVLSALALQAPLVDRTFDISGLSLHVRCGGERLPGQPVVVLEAGGGNSADTWRDVQAPIAAFARVCAYDRPGRGSSERPAEPLDPAAYVPLLADLLNAAGEPGPYVLVGHSIGGVIAALFANVHPEAVAGLVLVDSSHEEQLQRFQAVTPAAAPPPAATGAPGGEPLPVRGLIDALGAQPWRGDVPVVVLTRGRGPDDPAARARHTIWLELQRDWATRSPQATQVVAVRSGHYIHNDQPMLVIDAVRSVLDRARGR
jgi:pimeloyl-ACP methyl ester carboxylesterase